MESPLGWTGQSSGGAALILAVSKDTESYCAERAGGEFHSPEQSVKPEVPPPHTK